MSDAPNAPSAVYHLFSEPRATLQQATQSINTVINANTPGVLSGAKKHEGKLKALFYLHVTLCENL